MTENGPSGPADFGHPSRERAPGRAELALTRERGSLRHA
jgi:hypothetical protein